MSAQQFIQTVIGGLAIGCIYSLIALGISMIIRATEILHFAQGEIMMIGAMTGLSALWMTDLPFVLVLAIGMIGGGVAALAIELSVYRTLRSLRVPLINIVVSTLGISLILQNVARLVWGSEPLRYPTLFAQRGIEVHGFAISPQLIWIVVLGLAMMILLQLFFRHTRLGVAMQAAAQDPEAAQLMGISVKTTTTFTFLIAGVMAGAGGRVARLIVFCVVQHGISHRHQGVRRGHNRRLGQPHRRHAWGPDLRPGRNAGGDIHFHGLQGRDRDGTFDCYPASGSFRDFDAGRAQDLNAP